MVTGDDNNNEVNWDLNGRQTSLLKSNPDDYYLEYDWDGRLRKGQFGSSNKVMEAKYAPSGARISKKRTWNDSSGYNHKYIVDVIGKVPVILVVLDADNNNDIVRSYIHSRGQVLMQHDGDMDTGDRHFYVHDRLGSVRQVIDDNATVKNCYTYDPWGLTVGDETVETIDNHYRFAGYIWDSEVLQYQCFRRQYDPILTRFTSRDPVIGKFQYPMTLHAYLYCVNDPINKIDPTGEFFGFGNLLGGQGMMGRMRASTAAMGTRAMALVGRLYVAAYVKAGTMAVAIAQAQYGMQNTTVSRWGRDGLQGGDWVMKGGNNAINYILSGKWQPGFTNKYAGPSSGRMYEILAKDLERPSGFLGFLKSFLGQRIYTGEPIP